MLNPLKTLSREDFERRGREHAAELMNNHATQLLAEGKGPTAEALFRRALSHCPWSHYTTLNLAVMLVNRGAYEEAEALVTKVPGEDYKIHLVRAFAHLFRGDVGAAVDEATRSDELDVGNVTGRFFGGSTILSTGDWGCGFEAMEIAQRRALPADALPRWEGQRVEHLLVNADQGYGDIVNFVRYLPWAAQRVRRLTFRVPVHLYGLLRNCLRVATDVVPSVDMTHSAGIAADAEIGLTGLPRLVGERPDRVAPPKSELLFAEPFGFAPTPKGRKRVGVVWAGNRGYARDHWRSARIEDLLPLAGNDSLDLFSLQVGGRAADIAAARAQHVVVDLSGRIEHDWCLTAGLVKQLDAIVTVDTAVAHIAGTLGRRTFLLLPAVAPDWRWLLGRDDTPWYPSVTLVRQERLGDWAGCVARVAEALR